MTALLCDYKRDGDLTEGEAIVTYEDGTRERIKCAALALAAPAKAALPELGGEQDLRESWSPGGQIYYTGGLAFGLDREGNTLCIGTEKEVKAAIENHKKKTRVIDNITGLERQIIQKEKESYGRRPEGTVKLRAQKPGRQGNKRVRPVSNTRRFRNNIRRPAPAKKPTRYNT